VGDRWLTTPSSGFTGNGAARGCPSQGRGSVGSVTNRHSSPLLMTLGLLMHVSRAPLRAHHVFDSNYTSHVSDADCLVCREISGDIEVPGGSLVDDDLVFAFHVPPLDTDPTPYIGHLLVSPKRHVDHFGDLDPAEAAAIGTAAARLSKALQQREPVERVFAAVIGTHVPHFHLHLLPRYLGTPPEVSWYMVDEWEGAKRGGPVEIASLVERLSSSMKSPAG
jgi:histidine triad (HIT) family protein